MKIQYEKDEGRVCLYAYSPADTKALEALRECFKESKINFGSMSVHNKLFVLSVGFDYFGQAILKAE